MQTLAQLLTTKGSHVWSISPEATVLDGLRLMAEKNIGALLIVENGQPVGMMSERDYARKVILEGRSSRDTRIRSIMSSNLVHISPAESVEQGLAVMTAERVRHLPVIEEGTIFGLLSIGDLVKAMIQDQQFTIERLEQYIRT
jgi:CBS domain-containing protein